MDQALQVLSADVLHRQVDGFPLFMEVVHPADVLMADLAGDLDLILEPLDCPFVGADLRTYQFESDLFLEFLVEGAVDAAHASGTQLLDNLVAAGK